MDSMPMHLAAALGKPGVALFGQTNPEQWSPWKSPIIVHRAPEPERVLADISPETVFESLRQIVAARV